jgi:exopolysaccharide biosynthesis polyprenyl glycosylphosphotransferase
VLLLVSSASIGFCACRATSRRVRYRHYEQGHGLRNVVVIGTNQLSYTLSRHIQNNSRLGYRFLGFVSVSGFPTGAEIVPDRILGGVNQIRQLARQHFVDEVVIAEFYPTATAIQLIECARELDFDVRVVSGYYGELTTAAVEYLGIFPLVALHRCRRRPIGLFCKRLVDVALSLAGLMLVAPLLVLIAIAVKLDSKGPVLYLSKRIGKRGRAFTCFKFRTMVQDAELMKKDLRALNERDGILFKVANDPRVTRRGKMLRKYSLDELPQLFNVLRGEMSLVGPRPPIATEVEKYEMEHLRRLEVLPGLTGLWQVRARHDPSFARYIALDTAYVENWTFWLDLRILLETASVVLRGTGA